MKTLLILRHAQAVHFGDTADHDRPLTDKGIEDAQRIGRLFRGIQPNQILSSTATRAAATADQVAEVGNLTAKVQLLRRLYESDLPEHLEILRNVDNEADCVLVVGHNPTFERLASALVHRPLTLKTGALAIVTIPIDQWESLSESAPSGLTGLFCPAMLKKRTEGQDWDKRAGRIG